jgi:hypothetical protein
MLQTFKSLLLEDNQLDFSILEKEVEKGNKFLLAAFDLYDKIGNCFEMQLELKDTLHKFIDVKIKENNFLFS